MVNNVVSIFIERKSFFLELLLKHIYLSYSVVIIATIIGMLLAISIEKYDKLSKIILSVINFLYTIPSIAMFGFLIPFFGIGDKTAIIALVIYALLPIVLNTYTGIKNIDDNLITAALAMGTDKFQMLYKIKIPLAIPVIFSGIKSSLTMTIALAGIASFIGSGGLGVGIYRGITTNNTELTIISSLLIAILAIISNLIIYYIEKIFFVRKSKVNKKKTIILSILILFIPLFYQYSNKRTYKSITIATKPMTEQYIIGEMLKQIIEEKSDIEVNLITGVGGGTTNIHIGMLNGEFDIYPEYTGTSWMQVLKKEKVYKEEYFREMNEIYEREFAMKYINMYGFNNTYGIAIRKELADKYNINTYTDLSRYSNLFTFGAEYDFFERNDGYNEFSKAYNMNFKELKDMDISLKYKAIIQNEIDVMVIFTTDAMLNNNKIKVLEDDLNFYPSYRAGNIVRLEIVEKYPELGNILVSFENILDDNTMSKLNYLVENDKMEAYIVARRFLLEKGLIK